MASITLAADELSNNPDTRVRVIAGRLQKGAERIVQLCRNAERPAGKASATPDAGCSLATVLTDVLAIGQSIALPGTRIAVEYNKAREAQISHHNTVFRIIMNLVCNATRVVNENGGGQISIKGAELKGAIVITVADSGPGLPDAVRRWLLPFLADCESGRDRQPSGLTFSASAAQRFGGRMELVSSSRSGTTFRVVLPPRMHIAPRSRPITSGNTTCGTTTKAGTPEIADQRARLEAG